MVAISYHDVAIVDTLTDAVQIAIDLTPVGESIVLCRRENGCNSGRPCPMCAQVIIFDGMTPADAIAQATAATS